MLLCNVIQVKNVGAEQGSPWWQCCQWQRWLGEVAGFVRVGEDKGEKGDLW